MSILKEVFADCEIVARPVVFSIIALEINRVKKFNAKNRKLVANRQSKFTHLSIIVIRGATITPAVAAESTSPVTRRPRNAVFHFDVDDRSTCGILFLAKSAI